MSQVQTSKFLSLILRHNPGAVGIELDQNGWANIDELLEKMCNHGTPIDRKSLYEIVAADNKQRYKIHEDGERIRANQGHSIAVDLQLVEAKPPDLLFHGTSTKNAEAIRNAGGIVPMSRQYVHLSSNFNTAVSVGRRHGEVIVLEVHSGRMYDDGYKFYRSENGVWLANEIPMAYIDFN